MCKLSPVSFHGDTIYCIDFQNQPFTPMKPIVENLGLDWSAQTAKLRANRERWGMVVIAIPSASTVAMIPTVAKDGKEREMLCLPVRKLPAYLASINPNKVREELRPKIELYQAESDDALWDYWMNGRAERQTFTPQECPLNANQPITPSDQNLVQALVRAIADKYPPEQRKSVYMQIWMRLRNHFRVGSYKQLLQKQMPEVVLYLARFEVNTPTRAKEELPSVKMEIAAPANLPVDMSEDRRKALETIARLSCLTYQGFSEARELVRIGCHPGPRTMRMTQDEREANSILESLQIAAYEGLVAAYNAIEAGYKFERLYNHG